MTTRASDALLRKILTETKTIALVGASNKPHRDSNGVMRFLQDKTGRIDMVDIFRNSADAAAPALDAIEIGAKFVWMQLDVVNEPAAEKVRAAGLEIVMNHCPAIEYPRLIGGSKEH